MTARDDFVDGEAVDLLLDQLQGMSRHLSGVAAPEVLERWNRDVSQLVDILFAELDARIRDTVQPWALAGSEELIPVEKLDKAGIFKVVAGTEMFSVEELLRALVQRVQLETAA